MTEATYGCEAERVHFDTLCCNVLLLELSRQMSLDEGGLESLVSRISGHAVSHDIADRTGPVEQGQCDCYRRSKRSFSYLSSATIADKNELECRRGLRSFGHGDLCV